MCSLHAPHALMLICYSHKYRKAGNAATSTYIPTNWFPYFSDTDHTERFEMNVADVMCQLIGKYVGSEKINGYRQIGLSYLENGLNCTAS
jgi:hypothetical protein